MKLGDLEGLLNWRRDTKLAGISVSLPLPMTDHGVIDPLPLLDLSTPSAQKVSAFFALLLAVLTSGRHLGRRSLWRISCCTWLFSHYFA